MLGYICRTVMKNVTKQSSADVNCNCNTAILSFVTTEQIGRCVALAGQGLLCHIGCVIPKVFLISNFLSMQTSRLTGDENSR